MDFLISCATGIIAGLLTSMVWFIIVKLVRPKVKISNCICKQVNPNGEIVYQIKIVNLCRTCITDVKCFFQFFEKQANDDYIAEEIKPIEYGFSVIDKYTKVKSKSNVDCDFAVIIQYLFDERQFNMKNKDNKIVFEFSAQHGLSGTAACQTIKYDFDKIIEGQFAFGKSVEII